MGTVASDRELASAPVDELSSLGLARARRRLSVDEVTERTGLSPEAVEALEQSRLYRFPTLKEAVDAAVLYTSALGISQNEARRLADLPVRGRPFASVSLARAGASIAFVAAVAVLLWFVLVPRVGGHANVDAASDSGALLLPPPQLKPSLPERSDIRIDVLNGSTIGRAATRLADRIAGLSYGIGEVENAARNDYPETRVYYTPGSIGVAQRLADELGVGIQELPGGDEPRRLIVIVGALAPLG